MNAERRAQLTLVSSQLTVIAGQLTVILNQASEVLAAETAAREQTPESLGDSESADHSEAAAENLTAAVGAANTAATFLRKARRYVDAAKE